MPEIRKPRLTIDGEELRRLYIDEMMSYTELQDRYGVNSSTLSATLRHYGIPRRKRGPRSPKHHGSWNGGRTIDKHGYVLLKCPDHPHATRIGYVREHRLVMEEFLGRLLDPREVVHHKNGKKDDNRPENLELYADNSLHLADELKSRCPKWTAEGRQAMREMTERKKVHIPPEFDVLEMYRTQTLQQIADSLGCSANPVRREILARGGKIKSHSERWQEAASQRQQPSCSSTSRSPAAHDAAS